MKGGNRTAITSWLDRYTVTGASEWSVVEARNRGADDVTDNTELVPVTTVATVTVIVPAEQPAVDPASTFRVPTVINPLDTDIVIPFCKVNVVTVETTDDEE